mgnify:FL=1
MAWTGNSGTQICVVVVFSIQSKFHSRILHHSTFSLSSNIAYRISFTTNISLKHVPQEGFGFNRRDCKTFLNSTKRFAVQASTLKANAVTVTPPDQPQTIKKVSWI